MDFILGYFQTSLRDWIGVGFRKIRSFWLFWSVGNPLSGCVAVGGSPGGKDQSRLHGHLEVRYPGECRTKLPSETPRGPSNLRDGEMSLQPSLRDFSPGFKCTQDFILGYFQTSLRDWIGSGFCKIR
jgi:hypothetical protein